MLKQFGIHHPLISYAILANFLLSIIIAPQLFADSPTEKHSALLKSTQQKELVVVELLFNNKSAGIHRCYRIEKEFWFPVNLFEEHAHFPTLTTDGVSQRIRTTLGDIVFSSDSIVKFDGIAYISQSALKKNYYVQTLFKQSIHSIKFLVPWRPLTVAKLSRNPPKPPDIKSPDNTLSFLHLETNASIAFPETINSYIELETGGRALDGTWDIMVSGDPANKFAPSRYHWTTLNRNTAIRIGTGSSQSYNLLPDVKYTGVQFAWNNRSILPNIDNERYSDSDVLLNIDRTQRRTLEGTGPPAGIAELRIDNSIVARQRIRFDGRYIFRNVRMITDLRIIEVYLYEHSLMKKPVEIIDYTRSVSSRSLSAGELLLHTGAGRAGNILADDNCPDTWTGFSHLLYGLSERITLESMLQHNPRSESADFLFGPVVSIGSRWNAALYGARSNNRYGIDASLFGSGKGWRFSERTQWRQKEFGFSSEERKERHLLRLQINPFSWLNTSLYGNYSKEGDSTSVQYLLPGGTLRLSPQLSVSAYPNDENENYRYEAYAQPRHDTGIRLRYQDKTLTGTIDHDIGRNNSLQFIHAWAKENGNHASSAYFYWYPGQNRFNRVRLGTSHASGNVGFSASWSNYFKNGLRFAIQYNHDMFNADGLSVEDEPFVFDYFDNERTLSISLSWDLGRSSKNRFYPINRPELSHTRGGLAGSLQIEAGSGISHASINDVKILLNGRRLGQRQAGGNFFIGNLKPGFYTVSVDPEKLPVELVVDRQNISVAIKSGSITEVIIPLHLEYGVAGRIVNPSNRPLSDISVCIVASDGNIFKKGITNQFGYYRVDGLRKGNYTARVTTIGSEGVDVVSEKRFSISNEYLFGIDIVAPGEPSKQGTPDAQTQED